MTRYAVLIVDSRPLDNAALCGDHGTMHYVLLFVYGTAVLAILSLVPTAQRFWTQWRRVRRTPIVPIVAVPEATAIAVAGEVTSDGPLLQSPLTGRPCVYWEIILRENQGRKVWVTLSQRSSSQALRLTDNSGTIRVNVSGAIFSLPDPTVYYTSGVRWLANETAYLKRLTEQGVIAPRWDRLRATSVIERMIAPEQSLLVYGSVSHIGEERVIETSPQVPLIISSRQRAALRRVYGWKFFGLAGLLVVVFVIATVMAWLFW